jgi:hypothetical protein
MWMVESMERRVLMAGNVSVRFVGDQLRLTGDDQDNVFTIAEPIGLQSNITSVVVITGLDGTTIDQKKSISFTVGLGEPFYYSSIKINTLAGNDSVAIVHEMNAINLSVDLGDGDDSLGGSQRFFGAVDVVGGEGRDRISLIGDFEKRVRIFPGGGRDRLYFSGYAKRGFEIDDSGSGGFTVLENVTARRESTIALGNASDRMTILNGRFVEPLTVFAKGGDDQITVDGFISNVPSKIYGNGGDDIFKLNGERINLSVLQ